MRIYATSRIYIMYNILSVSTVRDAADGFQFESDEAAYSGNNNNMVLYVYVCLCLWHYRRIYLFSLTAILTPHRIV